MGKPAAVGAGHDPGPTVFRRKAVQHPHGIHHDRRRQIEHFGRNVAVETLVTVPRTHDPAVQASQDQRRLQVMLEDGQDAGVIDDREEDRVQGRQVGDVPAGTLAFPFFADLFAKAYQHPAHRFYLVVG